MSDIALLHVTFGDAAEAARVARTVVAERLAVCAQLTGPCTAIYRWRDDLVEDATEYPALFKTTPELARALAERIGALHSYDLPVIEMWPVGVADAVYDWVRAGTGG